MTSDAILERLLDLHPKLIDLSLDRTLDLLKRLGNPQLKLPPVVHVAGTNGKGSTLAFLRAIAEAAGYRVHVYTSPHLARFHERIRLAGNLISEPDLVALLEDCERVNEGRPITFFEITTCAAFKAMAETRADLVLLETGLGGRLDSTNVVPCPVATAITPISLDHTQFLGPTIADIAAEKAAIQKRGSPSVISPQEPQALKVVETVAEAVGAPQYQASRDYRIQETETGLSFTWNLTVLDLPKPRLLGAHQTLNAGTACALGMVLRDKGFSLAESAFAQGVCSAFWPARFQTLLEGPIIDALPGWQVVLDGGHNEAAGQALATTLEAQKQTHISRSETPRPLYAICGMLNSKAAMDFLAPLAPHLQGFIAVEIPGEASSFSAEDLASMARSVGLQNVSAAPSIEIAVDRVGKQPLSGRLCILGSLYLAGHILRNHS